MKAEKNDLVGIYVKNLLFDSLPVDLHVILHPKYAPLALHNIITVQVVVCPPLSLPPKSSLQICE